MSVAYSSNPVASSVEERRAVPRTLCPGTMAVYPYPGPGNCSLRVRCRDISPTGIGIAHCAPLPLRSVFAVAICDPEPTVMLYVIVHCTPNSRGGYDIGARLTQVLRQRDSMKEDKKAISPRGQFMRSLLMTAASRSKPA